MTPHNEAAKGDYAEAVLLPGDPLRAKWIADTFLEEANCVNKVRNALGFTGRWKGRPVSVQATGMGQASTAIYVHELLTVYGAGTLIRVGTCGAISAHVKLRDIVIAMTASTDSAICESLTVNSGGWSKVRVAMPRLSRKASSSSRLFGMPPPLLSSAPV